MSPNGIALTIDIDWVPDELIRDTIECCDLHDVPVTVFSTHEDGVTLDDQHERALHPNFFDESDDSAVLSDLEQQYPDAHGLRSHGLYTYTNLRNNYERLGLTYESNYLMFGQDGIEPFRMHKDVFQFPIYFMDDMWIRRGRPTLDDWCECDTVCVFAFHPIHVYLNTPTIEYYERYKDDYHDPGYLLESRYDGRGVRELFIEVLRAISDSDVRTETLGTYEEELRAQ